MTSQLRTRREVLRVLGVGAGIGAVSAWQGTVDLMAAVSAANRSAAQAITFPDGAIIRTILEDVAPEALGSGATLFHEHLSLNVAFWETLLGGNSDALAQRLSGSPPSYFMEDFDLMLEEVRAAAREGIACIVASGGYHIQPFYPPEISEQSEDEIASELVRDAETERWGAFGEIGSSEQMTPDERKMLGAVGRAHLQTGIPIFTHTANGSEALTQLDILEALGIDPEHIVIGHMGSLPDPRVQVHSAVAARGAFVGFDRLARGPGADAIQVEMITVLIEAGYADNVLLASDFSQAEHLQRNGGAGYAKTVTQFVPLLREAGVDEEAIRTMTIDNPRRFLAFVPMG